MMTKRRQALGFQLFAIIGVICLIAYIFLPATPDRRFATDNWYEEDTFGTAEHKTGLGSKAAAAAAHQELKILPKSELKSKLKKVIKPKPVKAAFVILARNSDLNGIRHSMRQIEDRFNRRFNYPYVFLNEEHFTEEFKEKTTALTKAEIRYGKIDEDMWGYPDHIDQTKAAACRKSMDDRHIIYGGSESYRHMCRFQSGFFFRHPLLDDFEYYWRVEPDIQYFCDVDYDVFQMMKDNNMKYGWTLSLTEYMETIPTLWNATQHFMAENPSMINWDDESLLPWLTDNNFETYNGCHFWSNFEIGSLDFFRSERYLKFFEHLDAQGGFFYERWGDAPVHSLAVAMMLKQSEVHFFNDIGYKHNPLMHCPIEPWASKKCHCDENQNFDWTDWSCATRYRSIQKDFSWNEAKFKNMTDPYRVFE